MDRVIVSSPIAKTVHLCSVSWLHKPREGYNLTNLAHHGGLETSLVESGYNRTNLSHHGGLASLQTGKIFCATGARTAKRAQSMNFGRLFIGFRKPTFNFRKFLNNSFRKFFPKFHEFIKNIRKFSRVFENFPKIYLYFPKI